MTYPYFTLNGIDDSTPILNQNVTLKDIAVNSSSVTNYLPLSGGALTGVLTSSSNIKSDATISAGTLLTLSSATYTVGDKVTAQGCVLGWNNLPGGSGETELINVNPGVSGGFKFLDVYTNYTPSSDEYLLLLNRSTATFKSNAMTNTGAFSTDGGKITTDGSGNLTINGNIVINGSLTESGSSNPIFNITGESHFANGGFSDPDSGIGRDAKFGRSGIAVVGGTKTDTLTVTGASNIDGGKITTNGSGSLTIYGSLFFPTSSNVYGSYIGTNTDGNIVVGTQVTGGGGLIGINQLSANSLSISGNCTFSSLPTSDPGVTGELWNNAGQVYISDATVPYKGVTIPTSTTSSSGDTATITFTLPKNGVYNIRIITLGVSSTTGNIVQQGFDNFAIYQTSTTGEIQGTIQESSSATFGNVSSATIKEPTYSSGTYSISCTATDGGTAGTWTWTSRIEWTLMVSS